MSININVISMIENKILFSGNVSMEEEICLEIFSFKLIAGKKIIISENDKKIIVYLNEIFALNYFEYIINYRDSLVNLITYFPGSNKNFEYLIQSCFKDVLFNFLKNTFYLKIKFNYSNFIYAKKIFLFSIVFAFILSEKTISQDKHLDQEEFLIQKNIYLVLNKISTEAKPEVSPYAIPNSVEDLDKRENSSVMPRNKKHAKPDAGLRRQVGKKVEVIDSEIQYFMQLKNK